MENLFIKKTPLQDLLSILNSLISTNERNGILTDHVIFKLCYNEIYQMKTTYIYVCLFKNIFSIPKFLISLIFLLVVNLEYCPNKIFWAIHKRFLASVASHRWVTRFIFLTFVGSLVISVSRPLGKWDQPGPVYLILYKGNWKVCFLLHQTLDSTSTCYWGTNNQERKSYR